MFLISLKINPICSRIHGSVFYHLCKVKSNDWALSLYIDFSKMFYIHRLSQSCLVYFLFKVLFLVDINSNYIYLWVLISLFFWYLPIHENISMSSSPHFYFLFFCGEEFIILSFFTFKAHCFNSAQLVQQNSWASSPLWR